jgi:hypothetical protein
MNNELQELQTNELEALEGKYTTLIQTPLILVNGLAIFMEDFCRVKTKNVWKVSSGSSKVTIYD